jgi:sec-independent protein translocase protein TatA
MPLMTPLIFNLGPTELIIILVIVLLLFGGSRLAGLGKSSGRALKEFKEETKGLRDESKTTPDQVGGASQVVPPPPVGNGQTPVAPTYPQQPYQQAPGQSPYQQGPQTPYQQGPQQPYQQAPQPYQPAPGNLNDPTAPDARRDV